LDQPPPFIEEQNRFEEAPLFQEGKMDWDEIERNWKRAKGTIKRKWIRLTDDDLKSINGQRERLEDIIHKRYGFAAEHVRKEVDDWLRWQG
jgi:uncharacterized protein YjbJ (UPF0337 family)